MSQTQVLCPQTPPTSPNIQPPERLSRRTTAEGLLREMAFVYHATQLVKKAMTIRGAKAALLACLAALSAVGGVEGQTALPQLPAAPVPTSAPDQPPPAPIHGPGALAPVLPPGSSLAPTSPFAPAPQTSPARRQRAAQEPGQRGRFLGRLWARFQGGASPQRGGR